MKKILLALVVCAAFCACSNDDVVVNNPATNADVTGGYISLAINLPTTGSTRAANDVYDDGLAAEYAVHDATLVLYDLPSGSTDEGEAVCLEICDLSTDFSTEGETNDNITSKSIGTAQIASMGTGTLYALVILNKGSVTLPTVDQTFSAYQSTSQELGGVSAMNSHSFYMCNAPLISVAGGSTAPSGYAVTTLALLDKTKVHADEDVSKSDPAGSVYVERGMAKVTVDASTYNGETSLTDYTATIDGFALDLTNNVSYPVRNTFTSSAESNESWWGMASAYTTTSITNPYRFAGSVEVESGVGYRTYWAVDPNYDQYPYTANDPYDYGTEMDYLVYEGYGELGDDNPQYCLENTFNVAHQNQDETTRAIVKATFAPSDGDATSFYTWGGDHTTLYTSEEDIVSLIKDVMADILEEEVADYENGSNETNFFDHFTISLPTETEASDDVEISITISTQFTDTDFGSGEIPESLSTDWSVTVATINDACTIAYYEDGVCYYAVLIKHFGDDLTPWDESAIIAKGNGSYPENLYGGESSSADWLGRYGVLRNNWYDLSIEAVRYPGSATPPSANGKPDDPTDLYISVNINILSWAKRTQGVTL